MKKTFKYKFSCLLLSLIMALVFTACQTGDVVETGRPSSVGHEEVSSTPEKPTASEESKEESEIIVSDDKIAYPLEMYYSSGVGAWYTKLVLHADGSFEGDYHDSDMGEIGEGYPGGTVYYCEFKGRFTKPEKVNDYTYSLKLESVEIDGEIGTVKIEEEMRFVTSMPSGLADKSGNEYAKEFVLYTPNAPIPDISENEEFLLSWPKRFEADPNGTLLLYGLRNLETNAGFFAYE